MNETTYQHIDRQAGWFSSDERKWINRIIKYAQSNPDEVQIIKMPEENDGCIYARVPQSWLRIAPPRKTNMSDERKAELAERLKAMREKQKEGDADA